MVTTGEYIIRPIMQSDNDAIKNIIRTTFEEFGVDGPNTAYDDYDTFQMFEAYQQKSSAYFVVENAGIVLGGAGIKTVANQTQNICELQKFYFLPALRGKGFGKKLLTMLLDVAKKNGFEYCYLESFGVMKTAIQLYSEQGFYFIEKSMGNTGHSACNVFMMKQLF